MSVVVELNGLEVFGYHGVQEAERRRRQRFVFDLELTVADAALSDEIEKTVDYRDVAARTRDISDSRVFHLLEALAAAVADAVVADFPVEAVRVRVRKPELRRVAGLPVAYSAATVHRQA